MMRKIGLVLAGAALVVGLGVVLQSTSSDAQAQSTSGGPLGLDILSQQMPYGTSPLKPIFSTQTNILKSTWNFSVAGTPAANAYCTVESGLTLRTRLRRICYGPGTAATGAVALLKVIRTSTAGSGTALTAAQVSTADPTDGNFSGTIRGPGTAGTAGADIDSWNTIAITTPAAFTTNLQPPPRCLNFDDGLFKSPVIPAGGGQGIAVTMSAAGTTPAANTATCSGVITEETN